MQVKSCLGKLIIRCFDNGALTEIALDVGTITKAQMPDVKQEGRRVVGETVVGFGKRMTRRRARKAKPEHQSANSLSEGVVGNAAVHSLTGDGSGGK